MSRIPDESVWDSLRALQSACHMAMRERGFHEGSDRLESALCLLNDFGVPHDHPLRQIVEEAKSDRVGNRLMLIVSEVAEALEEVRKGNPPWYAYASSVEYTDLGKPEGVPSEIADIVIRCFDFAGEYDIDLADEIRSKMVFNEQRPYKHGKVC